MTDVPAQSGGTVDCIAARRCRAGQCVAAVRCQGFRDPKTTVHFVGGPWDGQTYETKRVVGPLFAVGHDVGNHYWFDTKSDPPTYFWDGTEFEFVDRATEDPQ